MPNWCYNNLDIVAETDAQRALLERLSNATSEEGFFNIIRPLPEALRETVKGTGEEEQTVFVDGCNNWYDWQVRYWGTKWDIDPISVELVDDMLSVSFDSAWAPPIELYEYLVEQGFKVMANYYEPGMCFAGIYEDGDDICIEDIHAVARRDESTWSEVEAELIDMYGIVDELAQYDDDYEMDDQA